ncbi:PEGA domain-containing protein [bacterium]|nr:PEGA domain-containing protein [bacterium]
MAITHGAFNPAVDTELQLSSGLYRVCEHPAVRGQAFVQEGRAGKVFQLTNGSSKIALKIFHPPYRDPSLVEVAEALRGLSGVPGLQVCAFDVLHSRNSPELVNRFHDLVYAMVMPWIDGPTWTETVLSAKEIPPDRCLTLALALVDTLVLMEQRKVAHADLSGANLITPGLLSGTARYPIELVDIEGVFTTQRNRPDVTPGGSPGYAHFLSSAPTAWGPKSDRFAGALLVSEILSWWDPGVRERAAGETFFEPFSTQQDRERADLMESSLRERWGDKVASCFRRAFDSPSLDVCPVFEEWRVALLDAGRFQAPKTQTAPARQLRAQVQAQMERARKLYEQRRFMESRQLYESILSEPGLPDGLLAELPMILEDLDQEIETRQREERSPEPSYITPEQSPIRPVTNVVLTPNPRPRPSWHLLVSLAATLVAASVFYALTPKNTVEPTSTPGVGLVTFAVKPDSLTMQIDGIPYAEPLRNGTQVKLAEGKHKLNFESEHHFAEEQYIYVRTDQNRPVSVALRSSVGQLNLRSIPSKAKVWLDGKAMSQTTDAVLSHLDPGSHQIRLSRNGYLDKGETVSIRAGNTTSLTMTLKAKPAPKPPPVRHSPEPDPGPAPAPWPAPDPGPAPGPPIWR